MTKEQIAQFKELFQNKQLEILTKKFDEFIEIAKKKPEPHFITQMPSEVRMSNFEKAPEEVSVKNLGDIEIPKEITVKNLEEIKIPDEVKVSNFPEAKEIQKVEVTNHKDAPDNTPFFTKLVAKATESIGDVFRGLWESGISLKQNSKKTPLYVIHVDEKGAPIGKQEFQVFGGGGSSVQTPTIITAGKVVVAIPGTPVALGTATSKTKKVTITASFNNTGNVWVGDSNVSASGGIGIPLIQGATYELEINNLATIFVDADNANDVVSYVALS